MRLAAAAEVVAVVEVAGAAGATWAVEERTEVEEDSTWAEGVALLR